MASRTLQVGSAAHDEGHDKQHQKDQKQNLGDPGRGAGDATKYVIPLELTDLAKRLGNFLDHGLETGAAVRLSVEDKAGDEGSPGAE